MPVDCAELESLGDGVPLCVGVPVVAAERVRVPVAERVEVRDAVRVGVEVTDTDAEAEELDDELDDTDAVGECVEAGVLAAVPELLTDAELLTDGARVCD